MSEHRPVSCLGCWVPFFEDQAKNLSVSTMSLLLSCLRLLSLQPGAAEDNCSACRL